MRFCLFSLSHCVCFVRVFVCGSHWSGSVYVRFCACLSVCYVLCTLCRLFVYSVCSYSIHSVRVHRMYSLLWCCVFFVGFCLILCSFSHFHWVRKYNATQLDRIELGKRARALVYNGIAMCIVYCTRAQAKLASYIYIFRSNECMKFGLFWREEPSLLCIGNGFHIIGWRFSLLLLCLSLNPTCYCGSAYTAYDTFT